MAGHYDVIIVGTGAGGGTLAHTLAPSGKRILLLERGDYLPREKENWEPAPVFIEGRYVSPDPWKDADGNIFQPGVHYYVGGATKLYGAALYRLRPRDFDEVTHVDGISPAWPLAYDDFEPWYTKAEWLYQVHGCHGEDPTEGSWSRQYPHPAVSHEPRIEQLATDLAKAGYHPFNAPCGILLDEDDPGGSTCIRCTWCDGYPCLVRAKADTVRLAYKSTHDEEASRLYGELKKILNHCGMASHHVLNKNFYMSMDIPVAGVAHQAGTCRFGDDPHTSVLDANCKAHELDNLYVVDTSFFPSIGAVNPALTAMANAIRVGEHLTERLA
jgi:choline dehydrogenase-like flavoprotein